jgi:hypothetical protein
MKPHCSASLPRFLARQTFHHRNVLPLYSPHHVSVSMPHPTRLIICTQKGQISVRAGAQNSNEFERDPIGIRPLLFSALHLNAQSTLHNDNYHRSIGKQKVNTKRASPKMAYISLFDNNVGKVFRIRVDSNRCAKLLTICSISTNL